MRLNISIYSARLHRLAPRPPFLATSYHLLLPPPRPHSSHGLPLQALRISQLCLFHSSYPRLAVFPFKLYDIGEGITEVEVLKWHVEVGQRVEEFDNLCEVQSDKSVVELTSPTTGFVHSLNVEIGDTVNVGQTLCEIRTEGDDALPEEGRSEPEPEPVETEAERGPGLGKVRNEESPEVAKAEDISEELGKHSETCSTPAKEAPSISTETTDEVTEVPLDEDLLASRDSAMDSVGGSWFSGEGSVLPSAPSSSASSSSEAVLERRQRSETSVGARSIVKTSPAVRTLAARLGVDLDDVEGTGDGGRVTKEDVHAAAGDSSVQGEMAAGMSNVDRGKQEEVTRVYLGRTRKVMWRAMGSMGDVPHFGYTHTLNLTPLLPYLRALNLNPSSPAKTPYRAADIPSDLARDPLPIQGQNKTTLLSFLVKGMLLALEEHPVMRSRVMSKGDDRWLDIRRDGIVGIAVSDPKHGLLTPSLPPLSPSTSLSSITSHLSSLRQNSTRPTPPANLIISSVGAFGESIGAMPVLPPSGGVAICAVGRAKWEVEWKMRDAGLKADQAEVEKGGMEAVVRCPVGWSGDHRVLEGAELIAFTESWKRYVEEPWRWIKVDG